jgi:hypothetical protein
LARDLIARNASLVLLAILVLLSNKLVAVSANSLSVEVNKSPPTYNIGDSISITGTATPNASVSVKVLDPNNTTKVESEVQVASQGNYSVSDVYTLNVTDPAGMWRVDVLDLSSNETADAVFDVVAIGDRLKTLGDQLISLQSQVQNLNGTIGTLSSKLSTVETLSATLTMYLYVAMAASIASLALGIVAITQYLRKRSIYNRLTGKTEKGRTKRR